MADAWEKEPDLLQVVLVRVREHVEGLDDETLRAIEADIRAAHGGERVRIAKRRPHLTDTERQALIEEAMTDAPDHVITRKFGISRATLYRAVKR